MEFTVDQKKIIDARDCNLLVSAAAGSGKTAVLVERIIQLVTDKDNPTDIDRFLVVTFTRAAAAQMREKISDAISDRLKENPMDTNLQKQAALVHNAQIVTIDSFCQYVLRNSFADIDLDPGFRLADEAEMKLLMRDVLTELLEELYASNDEEFLYMVNSLVTGAEDSELDEIILDLFDKAMSAPWPKDWIEERSHDYEVRDLNSEEWFLRLKESIYHQLKEVYIISNKACKLCCEPAGPYYYAPLIERENESIKQVIDYIESNPDASLSDIESQMELISFDRLPGKKDEAVDEEIKEHAKNLRDSIKKQIETIKTKYLAKSDEAICLQMNRADRVIKKLCQVTYTFIERLDLKKKELGKLSFADCEHLALNVLVRKNSEGKYVCTDTAKEYRQFFEYIFIDEYQDSNLIQELLLSAVSGEEDGKYNRFMVGDVKQSIYRFRQADPDIFMQKYDEYHHPDENHVCIDLHQNFRSRSQVIDTTNSIFSRIMSKSLGDVTYDDTAALKLGAEYPQGNPDSYTTVFNIYDKDGELSNPLEFEAKGVANEISNIMSTMMVRDEDKSSELRHLRYGDIVILLRSPSGSASIFKQELEKKNIPVHVAGTEGYFTTYEIRTLMQLLRIVVNPLQDIPFVGVMESAIGGFAKDEIAQIRVLYLETLIEGEHTEDGYLYDACKHVTSVTRHKQLSDKVSDFLNMLDKYRELSKYIPVEELLYRILKDTDYRAKVFAMPGGEKRLANVDLLIKKASDYAKTSYFGLYNFLRYIETVEKYEMDDTAAEVIDENADVVRIMSIHKSKGLEFPVVFVSALGKQFNERDLDKNIVIDKTLGIGIKDIDLDTRVRGNTLRRLAITDKMKDDLLSEEMRVLYVALTRAKEHLILTAALKKPVDILNKLSDRIGSDISPEVVRSASGFSDWILMSLASSAGLSDIKKILSADEPEKQTKVTDLDIVLKFINSSDIDDMELDQMIDFDVKRLELESLDIMNRDYKEYLERLYTSVYPYANLEGLYSKTSVSDLKHAAMPDDEPSKKIKDEISENQNDRGVAPAPRFITGTQDKPGATVRGSAFHRVLELVDIEKIISVEKNMQSEVLKAELDKYEKENKLTAVQRQIFADKKEFERLCTFFLSDTANRMAIAQKEKKLFREAPFMLGLSANRVEERFPEEETVLIQGIIDVYWEEDDGCVILDYKTDRVNSGNRLIELYKTQLDYYEIALNRMHKKVKDKLIYSFEMGREIRL